MSFSIDIQFIARPVVVEDDSFGGMNLGDIDSTVSDLAQVNLSASDSLSQSSLSSTSESSSSEEESSGDNKPRDRKIRVHLPPKRWTTDADKESRRGEVDYTEVGTPEKDDRRKDKTWNVNVPRTNTEFTIICPPTKKKAPRCVIVEPNVSSSSSSSSEDSESEDEGVVTTPIPGHSLFSSSSEELDNDGEVSTSIGDEEISQELSLLNFSIGEDPLINNTFEDEPVIYNQPKLASEVASPGGTKHRLNYTPKSEKVWRRMVEEKMKILENK